MADKATWFDSFRPLLVRLRENFVIPVHMTSVSSTQQNIEQLTEGLSTQTIEKMRKDINSVISHIVRVNRRHIEKDNS